MGIFDNPLFGKVAGSVLGGILGGSSAKRLGSAMNASNMMKMMPYLDARDNYKTFYGDLSTAYNAAKDAGYYQGDTLAGMNQFTKSGLDAGAGYGQRLVDDGTGMMDAAGGFAGNYKDLYNQASQNMLGNAINYAAANTQPLLDAAMRDERRDLTEREIPVVQRGAMGSGNTNSSMSGVNQAILERGYGDRRADMATIISDRLVDRSMNEQANRLANMTAANQNLAGLYDMGASMGGRGAGALTDAGTAYRADDQARLDDDRMRYEGNRDYDLGLLGLYGTMLSGAFPGLGGFGSTVANTSDPLMAALSGMVSGAGYGGNIFDSLSSGGPMDVGTGYFQDSGGFFGSPSGYTSYNPTDSVNVSSYY